MKKSLVILVLGLITFYSAAYADRAGGGGNTVGDQLFDDYENTGTVVIPKSEISALAAPILKALDNKIPEFAKTLREGISGIIWYREPKPLNQNGLCKDGSETGMIPPIGQVVRACQNRLDVRIEKTWYDKNKKSNPTMVSGLIVHELLVFQAIRLNNVGEEAVLLLSRDIRSSATSAEVIKKDLKVAGFGEFETADEIMAENVAEAKDKYDSYVSGSSIECAYAQSFRLYPITADSNMEAKGLYEQKQEQLGEIAGQKYSIRDYFQNSHTPLGNEYLKKIDSLKFDKDCNPL